MNDTLTTIKRSARHFFSGTLLSRISGMLRDMSMAFAFGTNPVLAGFMIAYRFAHLLRRMFGEGALQSAFIPEFESLRQQNESKAWAFFRDLTFGLTFALIAIVLFAASILTICWLWGNFSKETREIFLQTIIMLPSLLFICLYGLNASLLQCQKHYFIPSVAPLIFNIIWIISVLCLQYIPIENAMLWLSFSIVIGSFFQWLTTWPQTYFYLKKSFNGLSIFKGLTFFSADIQTMLKPLSLGILGVSASQINNAIDALFARYADTEGPALLWYAIRIQQLPLALFGIAIAGAVLPPLARAIKNKRTEDYHHFLKFALIETWNFILPLTLFLYVAGDIIVSLIYGRGDFQSHSIFETTKCLWAYIFGLAPTALILILAPANYAKKNYKSPAYASLFTLIMNLFLNSVFIFIYQWGAISVALATSISAWANFLFLSYVLFVQGTPLFTFLNSPKTLLISISAFFTFFITLILRTHFTPLNFFSEQVVIYPSFLNMLLLSVSIFSFFFGVMLLIYYNLKYLIGFFAKRTTSVN